MQRPPPPPQLRGIGNKLCKDDFSSVSALLHARNSSMKSIVGVLDEPYSAKPAQRSSHIYRPAKLHRTDTVPAYVDWLYGYSAMRD